MANIIVLVSTRDSLVGKWEVVNYRAILQITMDWVLHRVETFGRNLFLRNAKLDDLEGGKKD